MSLDLEARTAKLSNKDEVRFEKALLATGSNVRILRVEGAQLDGIHYLRTIGNSDALREELARAERVALIGGSYIGTELAASFTTLGKQCELIMLEAVTHERFYGPEVGRFFQDTLTEHGVKRARRRRSSSASRAGDRVERVVTKSGLEIECDFVVIGAGVTPDITLAQRAGLETDSGVLVDRYLETQRARRVRGRRHRRVRQRRARPPAAHRALGRRVQPGQVRGAEHARPAAGVRRRALLLVRPRGLVPAWSTSARRRLGRGLDPRQHRRGQVHRLLREGRRGSRRRSRSAAPTTSPWRPGC